MSVEEGNKQVETTEAGTNPSLKRCLDRQNLLEHGITRRPTKERRSLQWRKQRKDRWTVSRRAPEVLPQWVCRCGHLSSVTPLKVQSYLRYSTSRYTCHCHHKKEEVSNGFDKPSVFPHRCSFLLCMRVLIVVLCLLRADPGTRGQSS